jgi:hypothetical protein
MEETKTTKIRPGLLVGLTTRVEGGVSYLRENLDPTSAQVEGDGKTVEKWNTTKIVEDAAEHERAAKAVGKARGLISRICSKTAFGLLCPKEREPELDAAVAEARRIIREYNAGATFTHARIYAIKGTIASSDEESARAIGEEVAQLIAAMNAGIDKLNPDAIREASNKAKQLQEMLGPDQAEAVKGAIEQARKAARAITKRVINEGEAAAIVLKDLQRGSLEKARIAFLDFEEQAPATVDASMPAVNVQRVAGLDLDETPASSGTEVQ